MNKPELPCKECGGQCCTFPAFTQQEFDAVKYTVGFPAGARAIRTDNNSSFAESIAAIPRVAFILDNGRGQCPYLIDGKCSIYKLRPKVCRDYGVVEQLPCQFLYPKKAAEMTKKMMNAFK